MGYDLEVNASDILEIGMLSESDFFFSLFFFFKKKRKKEIDRQMLLSLIERGVATA